MNIHLLRSAEFDLEAYDDVISLLSQHEGPLNFIDTNTAWLPDDVYVKFWLNEKDFNKKRSVEYHSERSMMYSLSFPREETAMKWTSIFDLCRAYRVKNNISSKDPIYLLTDHSNSRNWFSGAEEGSMNGFVHTANWDYFIGSDRRFPITYLIATLALQQQLFADTAELSKALHQRPRGCMMDFCRDKQEIIHKMRTADVCPDCMRLIIQKHLPRGITQQVLSVMEGVRTNMLFKERFDILEVPSHLAIEGHNKRLLLTELGNLEIKMTPLEKCVYLLFLKYPDGIRINELPDYRSELETTYGMLANVGSNEEIRERIDDLVNPLSNSASEKISRIKQKFQKAVGTDMAAHYIIQGPNGELKKINLDRSLLDL